MRFSSYPSSSSMILVTSLLRSWLTETILLAEITFAFLIRSPSRLRVIFRFMVSSPLYFRLSRKTSVSRKLCESKEIANQLIVRQWMRCQVNTACCPTDYTPGNFLLPAPLRFLTHASIRFHSIFKLDLAFEHENWLKRDLVASPLQLIGRVPKKCSKSRLVKNSSGFY